MRRPAFIAILAMVMSVPLLALSAPAFAQEDDYTYDDYTYDYDSYDDWGDWDYDYDYEYEYDDLDSGALAAMSGFFAIYFGIIACVSLVSYIYMGLCLSTIGKKLGVENGWMAWVPIANIIYLFKLAGLSLWFALAMLVPMVNIGVMVYAFMKIAERRGFQSWLGLLMLVPVANFILPAYLAWGKSDSDKSGTTTVSAPAQPVQTQPAKPEEKSETPPAPQN